MAKTLSTIAKKANVHVSLVSRVLRADPQARVSDETRALILSVAKEIGYKPNRIAQSLRTKRTFILGMLIPDITNVFHSMLFKAVERAASAERYNVILCNTDDDPKRFQELSDILSEGHVDGLLIATAKRNDPAVEWIKSMDIPHIFLNRRPDSHGALTLVAPDDYEGGVLVGTHFGELGHKRLLLLLGDMELNNIRLRERGFLDGLKQFGVAETEVQAVKNLRGKDDTCAALEHFLPDIKAGKISAIFASNTLVSNGLISFLFRNGLRSPEDVSVVGYSVHENPDITSLVPPVAQVGELAAQKLIDFLSGKETGQTDAEEILLPVDLVRKSSTRSP